MSRGNASFVMQAKSSTRARSTQLGQIAVALAGLLAVKPNALGKVGALQLEGD